MSKIPAWHQQLEWKSPAIPVIHFVTKLVDTNAIALGAGLYVFTSDNQALSPRNVLYVGKSAGVRQTLRARLSVYFRRLARPHGKPSRHAGLEALLTEYQKAPAALYVRWAGCFVAREVEGALIDLFDPICDKKDELRYAYSEDELIPPEYLYDVNA